jgi:hypothetical protein
LTDKITHYHSISKRNMVQLFLLRIIILLTQCCLSSVTKTDSESITSKKMDSESNFFAALTT